MEELLELREFVVAGNLDAALSLIDELEEMSKEDKINKIYSYCVVLLVHLIKQQAEKRTTHSWDVSIRNSIDVIDLSENSQPGHSKPSPHFLKIPKSI